MIKSPKRLVRNPDGTKSIVRPHRVAIDQHGNPQRVMGGSARADVQWKLPDGWRWATERDAHHAMVAEAIEADRASRSRR